MADAATVSDIGSTLCGDQVRATMSSINRVAVRRGPRLAAASAAVAPATPGRRRQTQPASRFFPRRDSVVLRRARGWIRALSLGDQYPKASCKHATKPPSCPERCGVTLAWRALLVPQYRCFCLTEEDRVAWGLNLEAKNLRAAIEAAHRACQEHLHASPSRVEIWCGANKLHVSSKNSP
jgi:hypothetical protein